MASVKGVVAVVIALTIAATMFSPITSSVANNSGEVSVTNETVTASYGEAVQLRGYDIVDGSETVYAHNDTTDSTEVAPSSDYTMDNEVGTITVDSSSDLIQDGESIDVSYDYQATTGQSTTVLNLVPLLIALLMLGIIAVEVMNRM